MCKLAIIPKITPATAANAFKFAKAITGPMTKNDDDGFGYMALGPAGPFGARYLATDAAWRPIASRPSALIDLYGPAIEYSTDAMSFGEHSDTPTCLALHSRMATCGVSLTNTHPFVSPDGQTALIHNGVITNSRPFERASTCDSEALLTRYLDTSVSASLATLNAALAPLTGWYAAAVLSRTAPGGYVLDVFRDAQAPLFAIEVPKLGGLVFVTAPEHAYAAARKLKWRIGRAHRVADNMAMRHDAVTGELLEIATLDVRPRYVALAAVPGTDTPADVTTREDYSVYDEPLSYDGWNDATGWDTRDSDPAAVDVTIARSMSRKQRLKHGME